MLQLILNKQVQGTKKRTNNSNNLTKISHFKNFFVRKFEKNLHYYKGRSHVLKPIYRYPAVCGQWRLKGSVSATPGIMFQGYHLTELGHEN